MNDRSDREKCRLFIRYRALSEIQVAIFSLQGSALL